MINLDEELARAAAEQDAAPPTTAPADVPREPTRRNVGLLLGLLAVGAGMLALVFTSFEGAAVYSKGVDELVGNRDDLVGRNVRVEGKLVQGTLRKRDNPCEYRFELTKNEATIPVRYSQCVVPDTFRDVPGMDVNVTAEGRLAEAGYFEAKQIMAKCPSKYEEKMKSGASVPYNQPIPTFEPEVEGPISQR